MKTTFFSLLINSSPAFKDRLYSFFEAFKKHLLFLNEWRGFPQETKITSLIQFFEVTKNSN